VTLANGQTLVNGTPVARIALRSPTAKRARRYRGGRPRSAP
jgi:hypothetical protein